MQGQFSSESLIDKRQITVWWLVLDGLFVQTYTVHVRKLQK